MPCVSNREDLFAWSCLNHSVALVPIRTPDWSVYCTRLCHSHHGDTLCIHSPLMLDRFFECSSWWLENGTDIVKTGYSWSPEQNTPPGLTTWAPHSPKVHRLISYQPGKTLHQTGRIPAISVIFLFDMLIKPAMQTNKGEKSETVTEANS